MIYKNESNAIQERVDDILARMTLKEKVAQLYCANKYGGEGNIDSQNENLKDGIGTLSYLNSS